MKNKLNFLLSLVFVAAGFAACEKGAPADTEDPIPVGSVEKVAEMNQAIGWDIFKQEQLAKPGENVLISPFSIQTALTMAANGAKGGTLSELLDFMNCPGCSVDDLNQLHKDLTTLLTEQSGSPTLKVANGFFYDPARMNVKSPFLDALGAHYACESENLDFNVEQAALDEINGWVKNSTNGKIDKILNQITALDVAFLINALHFKADWATGFAQGLTVANTFTKADGSTTQVDFVNADRNFSFVQTEKLNLVDIPFKDSTFSVSFIQPSMANTDADWHLNISPEVWKAMYMGITYNRAIVYFPKLKLTYENDLIKSLQNLGVNAAFSEFAADFTDMGTATKNIFISQIKHKVVLEMDEKGAEGAAVTSIGFSMTSLPPVFRFNNPFVLVLRHIPTNTMIFTGFVADPTP
jgi:serpin B